jgi:hypothetical protein
LKYDNRAHREVMLATASAVRKPKPPTLPFSVMRLLIDVLAGGCLGRNVDWMQGIGWHERAKVWRGRAKPAAIVCATRACLAHGAVLRIGRTRRLPEGTFKMPEAAAFFSAVSRSLICSTTHRSSRLFSILLFGVMDFWGV